MCQQASTLKWCSLPLKLEEVWEWEEEAQSAFDSFSTPWGEVCDISIPLLASK